MPEILVPPGDAKILGAVTPTEDTTALGEYLEDIPFPKGIDNGIYSLYDLLPEDTAPNNPTVDPHAAMINIRSQLNRLILSPLEYRGVSEEAIVSGAYNQHVGWHPDSPGSLRFLTNLSAEHEAKLDIATSWDPSKSEPGEVRWAHRPKTYRELVIPPGHTYCINALASNIDVLRPHRTHKDVRRLMLRTRVFYTEGWESLAEEDSSGITAVLKLPEL